MDNFKNAETKMRSFLDDYDIEIKKLKSLNNSHNKFRKVFAIEMEEYKRTTLEDLQNSLRRDNKEIQLEIM